MILSAITKVSEPMSEKVALIVATSEYEDAALRQLVAPAQDAESLARVLGDPAIGGFHVRKLVNELSYMVNLEIEAFCDNRKRDDLLLLYFSGHGIKDVDGQIYFATVDTQLVNQNVRRATAVGAHFINQVMSRSRSRRQILLLDCCYSGAFMEGMLTKGGKRVGVGEHFEGQGRVVLTASDALQYSFEGGRVQGESACSVFTHMLVRGLETGEADLDRDGMYSLDEVYDYVYARVSDEQSEQKPMKMGYVEGKIFIGSNPRPQPATLAPELLESLEDRRPWVRRGSVHELEKLLATHNKGLVLAVQDALTTLAKKDDSLNVRTAAEECLARLAETPAAGSEEPADEGAREETWPAAEEHARREGERPEAERLATKEQESFEKERVGRESAEGDKAEALAERVRLEEAPKLASQRSDTTSSDAPKQNDLEVPEKERSGGGISAEPGRHLISFRTTRYRDWGAVALQKVIGRHRALVVSTRAPKPTRRWQEQSSGIGTYLLSVAFVTPQSGWAVGFKGTILHTEDGGGSWKMQSGGTGEVLFSVVFATPQSGWAIGADGTILHTEDGGSTWKPQVSGTGAHLGSVAFATLQSGWAVGVHGTVLHTEDGGGTWKTQTSGTRTCLRSVAFATPQSGWAVGSGGTILHTEDSGGSWQKQSSGCSDYLHCVFFATPQSGWAVGAGGTILHTEDGGMSWQMQGRGTNACLRSIAFPTPQSGWAVGDQGIILHTADGGSTWKTQTGSTSANLNSIGFATPQSVWAVGDQGIILRW